MVLLQPSFTHGEEHEERQGTRRGQDHSGATQGRTKSTLCYETEEIPEEWARGLVVPKTTDGSKIENYRGLWDRLWTSGVRGKRGSCVVVEDQKTEWKASEVECAKVV